MNKLSRGSLVLTGFIFGLLFSVSVYAAGSYKVLNIEHEHVPNQVIVKFKDNHIQTRSVNATFAKFGAKVEHEFHSTKAVLVTLPSHRAALEMKPFVQALNEDSNIEYVEANTIMKALKMPNDPRFGELYGLHNNGSTGGKSGADIKALDAWNLTTGSKKVLVGIIDTGIDYNHPDLKDNYWYNSGEMGLDENGNDKSTNGLDNDGNGYINDWRGWNFADNTNDPIDVDDHGSHCAGTIGASGNNDVGVVGVNWEVSFVALKFLGEDGGTLADAVKAIEYATKIGVDMTSNSWGGGGHSPTMEAAIKDAADHGILFIAAAGNDGKNNDGSASYPASYKVDNVISVAANDANDELANFSNYGKQTVHLSAPGVGILSTTPNDTYSSFSGTSMATPHVSGVAALIKSLYPDVTMSQLKNRILFGADPVDSMKDQVITGGRLNAFNSLENDNVPPTAISNISVEASWLDSVDLQWSTTGDDAKEGQAVKYELKYARDSIISEEDWKAAQLAGVFTAAQGENLIKGSIKDLPFNYSGYVAIRAYDNVGNLSELSTPLSIRTAKSDVFYTNNADDLNNATAEGDWGIKTLDVEDDYASVFTSNLETSYKDNINDSLTFAPIKVSTSDIYLSLRTQYNVETRYDNGYVEVSADGQDWATVLTFSGKTDGWIDSKASLKDVLPSDIESLHIRFRLKTDSSATKTGWMIDSIQLVKAN